MIEMNKPQRKDAIAQELRAMEDRKKEITPVTNKGTTQYWVALGFLIVLAAAIVLL